MSPTKRFVLLSILLAMGIIFTAGGAALLRYGHSPPLKKLNSPSGSSPLYQHLKPEANTPQGIYYRDKVTVLMYHDVQPFPIDSRSLPLAKLDKQIQLLKDNNFHIIDMEHYKAFLRTSCSST